MKKSYEKFRLIFFIVAIFILFEIVTVGTFYSKKYRDYKILNTIVITGNYTKSYLDSKEYNLVKSNNYLYIDDKKTKYEIVDVKKNVLRQDNRWYHEILFKIKFSSRYKDNDTVSISAYNHKEFLFNIFKKCWEDDIWKN
mgnify:CR=1 FL=1